MKIFFQNIWFLFMIIFIGSCSNSSKHNQLITDSIVERIVNPVVLTRDTILSNLKNKIEQQKPLVIHVFVALYGSNTRYNENLQSWADGLNLNTNLYWGAAYGLKNYFKNIVNWKQIYNCFDLNKFIAERIIFTKTFGTNTKVILILDAYLGYHIKACMSDFFCSLNESKNDSILIDKKYIEAYSKADLIVYNGHNGLMDFDIKYKLKKCKIKKEAVGIACRTYSYFTEHFKDYSTYPLLTTTDFIPAEAYILHSIIEPWALLKSAEEIRKNVVLTYKSIIIKEAEKANEIFKSGW